MIDLTTTPYMIHSPEEGLGMRGGEQMTYYESYSSCQTEDEIKEKAIADTKIAIFLGNNPDRIKAIENAMNNAIANMRGESDV